MDIDNIASIKGLIRAVLVAALVMLGIYFSTSFILALRVVLVGKLVISGILPQYI